MRERKRQTVEEFIKELESDPVWRAKHDALEAKLDKRAEEFAAEERPLVADLRKAGFKINSLQELFDPYADRPWERQPQAPYPAAIPVLLKHVRRKYSSEIRDTIARTMAVSDSRPYWSELKQLYLNENDERVKDGFACIVSAIAKSHKALLPEVVELMHDRRNGASRILMVDVLTHYWREPSANRSLQQLKNDPDLRVEIGRRLHEREVRQRRKARRSKARS